MKYVSVSASRNCEPSLASGFSSEDRPTHESHSTPLRTLVTMLLLSPGVYFNLYRSDASLFDRSTSLTTPHVYSEVMSGKDLLYLER